MMKERKRGVIAKIGGISTQVVAGDHSTFLNPKC
jgi:hypothetical protein